MYDYVSTMKICKFANMIYDKDNKINILSIFRAGQLNFKNTRIIDNTLKSLIANCKKARIVIEGG